MLVLGLHHESESNEELNDPGCEAEMPGRLTDTL